MCWATWRYTCVVASFAWPGCRTVRTSKPSYRRCVANEWRLGPVTGPAWGVARFAIPAARAASRTAVWTAEGERWWTVGPGPALVPPDPVRVTPGPSPYAAPARGYGALGAVPCVGVVVRADPTSSASTSPVKY